MNMYERLTAELAAAIRGGELAGGSAAAGAGFRQAARHRSQHRRAGHASLRQQGLVIGEVGRGTFVRERPMDAGPLSAAARYASLGRSAVALEAQELRAALKACRPARPGAADRTRPARWAGRRSSGPWLRISPEWGWMSRRSGSASRMADRPRAAGGAGDRAARGSGWRPTPSPIPAGSSSPASSAWTWNRSPSTATVRRTSWSGYCAAGGSRRCTACPWRICPWAGSCRAALPPSPSWPASMISR